MDHKNQKLKGQAEYDPAASGFQGLDRIRSGLCDRADSVFQMPLPEPRSDASADRSTRTGDLRRNPVHLLPLPFHNTLHPVLGRTFWFVRIRPSSTEKDECVGTPPLCGPESTRNPLLNSRRSPRPEEAGTE